MKHFSKYLNFHLRADGGIDRRHHGQRQRFADAPAIAAGGGAADQLIAVENGFRASGIGIFDIFDMQSDIGPSVTILVALDQGLFADKFLGRFDEAIEPGFIG